MCLCLPRLREKKAAEVNETESGSQTEKTRTVRPSTAIHAVDGLRSEYTPARVLRYGDARAFLYGVVDNVDGVLTGIYGTLVAHVENYEDDLIESDGQVDEKTLKKVGGRIRKEAAEDDINLEHLWPQSLR